MLKVHKTRKAESDLIGIWLYSMAQWGETQADLYLDELEYGINALTQNPEMGSLYEYREGYRKLPVKSHIVFYRLNAKRIEIVRVLHKRMDVGKNLTP